MKYLAIDTSGSYLTVIACDGKKTSVKYEENCALNHSVALMGEVENALAEVGLTAKDIDVFACSVGAGSFTGIRIGVSTAKALCFSYKIKCLKLTSFDVLAYNDKDFKEK